MAESTSGARDYAGNSNRDKGPAEEAKPRVEKVTEGVAIQRKKPLGRRIAENFTGADAHSVGQYVLFEVVLPRIKDLVFDVGESALRRALFGDSVKGSYSSRSSSVAKPWTPYATVSTSGTKAAKQPAAPSDEFGEIVVETRGEAQEVMDKLGNLIETYGQASVSDLKAAVGISGSFTDESWGWVGLGGADIRRVGGQNPGYALILPRPEQLS